MMEERLSLTLKLDIPKETEAGLLAQAQARGLSLESYAQEVLASAIFPTQAEAIEHARTMARCETGVQRRPAGRKSLARLFAESPFKGADLNFERDPDTGRSVGL